MEDKKVSIIVPLYNTEQYIERCIKSICNQTYENLEIIVVNDCSTDNSIGIVSKIMESDERISICTHEHNKGLYRARISGVQKATGDYIGFVDSDDFISNDFIRTLVYKAIETESDVVVGKLVHENENGFRYIHNLYDAYEFGILEGKEITKAYWNQEGRCYIWHTIWNKLYSREIWEKALPILTEQKKHLIMTEDFVFSSVLLNYANKLTSVDYGTYYYFQHGNASTSLSGGVEKYEKNISDLKTAFEFVHNFITSNEYRIDAKEKYNKWSDLYRLFWMENIDNSRLNSKEKNRLISLLNRALIDHGTEINCPSYFYEVTTEYDDRYDNFIKLITSKDIEYVSFDIFNTAVIRPLYNASDLFVVLNTKFDSIFQNEKRRFSDIRIRAEKELRNEVLYSGNSTKEDISIDEIYCKIREISYVPDTVLAKMLTAERELEIELCRQRKSIHNAYQAALHCGKKILFTSDMYLEKETLKVILDKCDYGQFEEILVSSHEQASKRTGKLYDVLIKKSGVKYPCSIVHVGDNWTDDVIKAKDAGLVTQFYPSAIDCIQYNISDIKATHSCCPYTEASGSMINIEKGLDFIGTRSALAVAANRIYDNPFISFNEWSEFNCSPKYLGYYAVGMHLLGFTKWFSELISKRDYNTVNFIARDGYLPMKAYEIINKYMDNRADIKYLNTSRKAAFACGIRNTSDIFALYDRINRNFCTPKKLLEMLEPVIRRIDNESFAEFKCVMDKPFSSYSEFCKFVKIIGNEFFDSDKQKNYNECVANYYKENVFGKTVCVDIGYSGRTQEILKNTTDMQFDAIFIHTNSDSCSECANKNGFKVYSYYDFTPTVTGGIREVIFSQYGPSCIGYDVSENKAKPIFEKVEYEYTAEYIVSEIQKYALEYVSDFCEFFWEYLSDMEMRSIDISYPYEYFLHTVSDADLRMFNGFKFEDDMWAGKTLSLAEYWKSCIDNQKIIPFYMQEKKHDTHIERENYVDGNLEYKLYIRNEINRKNLIKKAIYWYLVDKRFFKQRVKDYLYDGGTSHEQ